jgi:phage/plasmid-like protein (TIGR03299 family)
MSHELEINEAGEAQMFSAQGIVPWHGLGKVFEEDGLTSEQALVAAGQDWTVELKGVGQEIGTDEDTGETVYDPINGWFSVQRSSDQRSVGMVRGRYNPLNNVDAFAFGDDILGLSGAHWITGGCLKEGSLVWMMAKLPEAVHIGGFEDEAIQPYVMVSNSHDGSKGLEASVVTVRVVCNNTFTAALEGAKRTHKIRHTKNMSQRMKEAKNVIGVVDTYGKNLRKLGDKLIGESFSNGDFDKFLETLVPTAGLDEGIALTKAQNKQELIKGIYVNKPDLQNIKGTKWGALQAVIDYNDHHIKGRGKDQAENRMTRILMPMQKNIGHHALDILTNV